VLAGFIFSIRRYAQVKTRKQCREKIIGIYICENFIVISVARDFRFLDMYESSNWTFFTNHAHVMVCLARNGDRPLREVAVDIGITERAVQRIVADLEEGGYLKREREGRRNRYALILDTPLRHSLEADHSIGDVLRVLAAK